MTEKLPRPYMCDDGEVRVMCGDCAEQFVRDGLMIADTFGVLHRRDGLTMDDLKLAARRRHGVEPTPPPH